MPWIRACAVDEVEEEDAVQVPSEPPVAVFRVDGEFLATADTCTHGKFPLSEGYVEDGVVECALHSAKFCLRTGRALNLPATEPLRTFPIRVEDGEVYVEIEETHDKEPTS
ncbi:MAG TPA: bifunctional 3-phenylpropionate/cinnamic acid dioxygenase ferredoxin subunit [Streptomyces sp.]